MYRTSTLNSALNSTLAPWALGSLLVVGMVSGLAAGNSAFGQDAAPAPASTLVAPSTATPVENSDKVEPVTAPEAVVVEPSEPVVADPMTLVPDLPSVGHAKATVMGGTIEKLDRVRDQMTVRVFGGGRIKVLFDPRTHVYRSGADGTLADLRQGQRVSVDTMLDGVTVFARNIRLQTVESMGDSQGTVIKFRADRNELTIRDAISSLPVRVTLNDSTKLTQGDHSVSPSLLAPGSLIAVRFAPDRGGHEIAHEISVLALPGASFTFAGEVVNLDLHAGLLVLNSSTDKKVYEIYLDPSVTPDESLHPGANVTLVTNFDGSRYVARQLTINPKEQ